MKTLMMKLFVAATVFVVYLSVYCNCTTDQQSPGSRMCPQTVSRVISEQRQTERYSLCWSWTFRCKRVIYRRESHTVYMLKPMCCRGYTINSRSGDCEPHCENCTSPKICTEPNKCTCPPGLTGQSCSEDFDECLTDNGGCEQICTNTQGSHICSCMQGYFLNYNQHNCTDLVNVEVTFIFIDYTTNDVRASLKLNIPSQNESAIPNGAKLQCNDSSHNVILYQNVTDLTTELKLDFNKTLTCCLSVLTTNRKCVTFNQPGDDTQGQPSSSSDNTLQGDTKLAIVGGIAGAIVLLLLLVITIIAVVLVYKACMKSKSKRLHLLNELSRSYDTENEIDGTHELDTEAHLSSGYTQIHSRERRVQYATIRFDNRSQARAAGKRYQQLKSASNVEDESGYLRILQ